MSDYCDMMVEIVGEPFISRVREYRQKMFALQEAWLKFADDIGASSVPHGLHGLIFEGQAKPPKGWTKQNRHGVSKPKRGSADWDRLAALPQRPASIKVFGDTLIDYVQYKGDDESGTFCVSRLFFGPSIAWFGGRYFACIPDAKAAADKHLAAHPGHAILNGADRWTLPDGLIRLTDAEYRLIEAQFDVEEERRERQAVAA